MKDSSTLGPKSEIHCILIANLASTAWDVSLARVYMCVLTVILRVVEHCLCPVLHLAGHSSPCVHYQTPVGGQLPQLDQGVFPTGQNVLKQTNRSQYYRHTHMIQYNQKYSSISNQTFKNNNYHGTYFSHVHDTVQCRLSKIYLCKIKFLIIFQSYIHVKKNLYCTCIKQHFV